MKPSRIVAASFLAIIGILWSNLTLLQAQSVVFPSSDVRIHQQSPTLHISGLRSPAGQLGDLELRPCLPAVDESSVILIAGKDHDTPIKPSESKAYIGTIQNDPGSSVILSYVGNQLYGIIQESNGQMWVLTRELGTTSYRISDGNQSFTPLSCPVGEHDVKPLATLPTLLSSANGLKELELAVETDVEFYKNTGGTDTGAANYLTALVSSVSALYQKELGVVIKLVWARIYTEANPDPYHVEGNPFALSDAVKANWAKYDTIHRDLFHAITASAGGSGGYAYTNSVCSSNWDAHGASSIQGWSGVSNPGFNYDTYIVAHEIGHNFGAQHTHSCFYGAPLDTCEVDEAIQGGCLPAGSVKKPNPGSIMSYCGWTNLENGFGYQVAMRFHDVVKGVILSNIPTYSCLSPVVLPVPQPLTPIVDTVSTKSVNFTWSSTWTGSYQMEITGDTTLTQSTQMTSTTVNLRNGHYQWRVRSTTVGAESEWSEWVAFTVAVALPLPTQMHPNAETVNPGTVQFTWTTSWIGTTELDLRGSSTWTTTSVSGKASSSLDTGHYEWRLRSVDGGSTGTWTDWIPFTVASAELPSVSLIAPVDDTVASGIVQFTWQSGWSGPFEFSLRGDTTAVMTVPSANHSLSMSAGSYEWRIRAMDGSNSGSWSDWKAFMTSDDVSSVQEERAAPLFLRLW